MEISVNQSMFANEYPNRYHNDPTDNISSSDSENDLIKKIPYSSSSESESDKKAVPAKKSLRRHIDRLTKPLKRSLKNTANAAITGINFADRARRRLKQKENDQRVQARQDLKYARRHPELSNYKDSVTKGQSLLRRGIFSSLLQVTESNGNTVYGNIMEGNLEPPKFQLVTDFINLNFLENIYFISFKKLDTGEEVRILVAAYPIESVIENGDDMSLFFSFKDLAFFPYELIDGELITLPTYAKKVIDLKSMKGDIGIIAEIGLHFPSTTVEDANGIETTTWQWDDEIANQLARGAILKNLTQIVEEEIKRKLMPGEVVRLYKYNLETGTKENLRVLSGQGALHAPNVMELLSQLTFGPNITNRKDFLGKIHNLHNLPLSKGARADNLTQNRLANQWTQQWQQQMPIGEAAAVPQSRVQTEQQQQMAAARLARFGNLGGTRSYKKNKRSKRHRKTKKRKNHR
jgi:hypothetical protein